MTNVGSLLDGFDQIVTVVKTCACGTVFRGPIWAHTAARAEREEWAIIRGVCRECAAREDLLADRRRRRGDSSLPTLQSPRIPDEEGYGL